MSLGAFDRSLDIDIGPLGVRAVPGIFTKPEGKILQAHSHLFPGKRVIQQSGEVVESNAQTQFGSGLGEKILQDLQAFQQVPLFRGLHRLVKSAPIFPLEPGGFCQEFHGELVPHLLRAYWPFVIENATSPLHPQTSDFAHDIFAEVQGIQTHPAFSVYGVSHGQSERDRGQRRAQ